MRGLFNRMRTPFLTPVLTIADEQNSLTPIPSESFMLNEDGTYMINEDLTNMAIEG